MASLEHSKQWEPKPKPKAVPSSEEPKVATFPTGSNVRAKIIADLTTEYVAHLELIINALKKGDTNKAVEYEIWSKALKQAIAIASE
jgi:hypothetical protein